LTETKSNKAFILLSGGQDSFTCVLWAKNKFLTLEAITIAYDQTHLVEVNYAKKIASHFNIEHTVYDIKDFFKSIAVSSILNDTNHSDFHSNAKHLPASFLPNRNGIFLTIAANHAFRNNEKHIHLVTGVCETDFSGYPDCRDSYMKAKAEELSLALDCRVTIHTPLMWLDKAQVFKMANKSGQLKILNEITMTCYNGIEKMNEWGRGCGECPACKLRKKGYTDFAEKGYL
jgi:7-cyano-7-deazaguanine synthase